MDAENFNRFIMDLFKRGFRFEFQVIGRSGGIGRYTFLYKVECEHGVKYGRGMYLAGDDYASELMGALAVMVQSAKRTMDFVEREECPKHSINHGE